MPAVHAMLAVPAAPAVHDLLDLSTSNRHVVNRTCADSDFCLHAVLAVPAVPAVPGVHHLLII